MKSSAKIIAFPAKPISPESAGDQALLNASENLEKSVEVQPNIECTALIAASESPVEETPNSLNISKSYRLDQLEEWQRRQYAENYRLVLAIKAGASVKEALKQLRITRPRRTVQDLVARYEKHEKDGLFDKRWFAKKHLTVLVKDVTDIALAWYFECPAAGYRAIAELTADSCRKRNLPVPSESSVKRYLCGLLEGVKQARKGKLGLKNWQRQVASVVEQKKSEFANELWQGDHHEPNIWIKMKVRKSWDVSRVHLSAFLDDFSRAIPGFIVSTKFSDAWSISILSYFSIMRKTDPQWMVSGLPFHIESDCGADWISDAVQTNWKSLGIIPVIDHPYYPNSKGKVERWFQTLDSNCLRKLPGHFAAIGRTYGAAIKHIDELLTLDQLRKQITYWIVNNYHQKVHSETGRKPIELWEENVHYRTIEEEDLNIFLLKYDVERTIRNCGVRLSFDGDRHRYWSPDFDRLGNRRVTVGYNPEDLESVNLYCAATGEFLVEAWDMRSEHPKYSHIDIKNARNSEKQYLKGLQVRTKDYYRNVLANDRLVEQEKEWVAAREKVKELPEAQTAVDEDENTVDDLINRFRRNDRRK